MLNLSKDESRLYNFAFEVINEVMDNYGYDYVIGESNDNKYYTSNMEEINVINKNNNTLEVSELISLGFYLFKRLGLDDIEVSINKDDEICNMLNTLEVEYLSNINSKSVTWKYIYDDDVIGKGSNNNFTIDVKKLLEVLMNNINKDALRRKLDVNILCNSEEEACHALKIAQDLRLNNINTEVNSKYNSKFNINLMEDELKKGIISVKDNALDEEIKIDESDIVDYLLGNI